MASFTGNTQYANDWIKFGQPYFKIKTGETGVYRLSYSQLADAGADFANSSPANFKLYHRGFEVALKVHSQADDTFDPGDYIEFFGIKNDGFQDASLYPTPEWQLHPEYNLYSDTTAYFLTWNQTELRTLNIDSVKIFNQDALPALDYWISSHDSVFFSRYTAGKLSDDGLRLSTYDSAEGWTGLRIAKGINGSPKSQTFSLRGFNNLFTSDFQAQLNIRLVSELAADQWLRIRVGPDINSLREFPLLLLQSFHSPMIPFSLQLSDFSAEGNLVVEVETSSDPDRVNAFSVSFAGISFREKTVFSANNSKVKVPVSVRSNTYLELTESNQNTRIWDVSDIRKPVIIGMDRLGSVKKGMVPNTNNPVTLFLSEGFLIPEIEKVNFRNFRDLPHQYIILSHDFFINSTQDVVHEYGRYRASAAGGNYDTLIVDVQQLFDQFNFGEISPLAIYNFIDFISRQTKPEYLLIIGNGFEEKYELTGAFASPGGYYRNPDLYSVRSFVPPAGIPGSDILYASGVGGLDVIPSFAVGRIPTEDPAEVIHYLNKVKEFEANEYDNLGRKRILHLSGGASPAEHKIFNNILSNFENMAALPFYGASTDLIEKPVLTPQAQFVPITEELNAGLNMITFFGHSGAGINDNDINIGKAASNGYNNKGKYPFILLNGCRGGFIYDTSIGLAENWLLEQERGAIALIGSSSYSETGALYQYSRKFYDRFQFQQRIGESIGQTQIHVIDSLMLFPYDVSSRAGTALVQQMVLIGDPAIKLFNPLKSDPGMHALGAIEVEAYHSDNLVRVDDDSLKVSLIVNNYGLFVKDSLTINIRLGHTMQDFWFRVPAVAYSDTLEFTLKLEEGMLEGGKINLIQAIVQPDDAQNDRNQDNNAGIGEFFVYSGGTVHPWPPAFYLSPERKQVFWIQKGEQASEGSIMEIEIDTTFMFNSPYLKRVNTSKSNLALEFNADPDSILTDQKIFWRSRLTESSGLEKWNTSSMTFAENTPVGWSQNGFTQFQMNEHFNLNPDSINLKWNYFPFSTNVAILLTSPNGSILNNSHSADIELDGVKIYSYKGKTCNNLNLIAFSQTDSEPEFKSPALVSDNSCGELPDYIFSVPQSLLISDETILDNFVASLHEYDTILVYANGYLDYSQWTSGVQNSLAAIGIDNNLFSSLTDSVLFVAEAVKGGAANLHQENPVPSGLEFFMDVFAHSGEWVTDKIGPSQEWQQLNQDIQTVETDTILLSLFGLNSDGQESMLMENIVGPEFDLSGISSTDYPFLKLKLFSKSNLLRTPINPGNWKLFYTPSPEGFVGIDLYGGEILEKYAGEELVLQAYYVNISDQLFPDSLSVNFDLLDESRQVLFGQSFMIQAPAPGDTAFFELKSGTENFEGKIGLDLWVNKEILNEMNFENNHIYRQHFLTVQSDKLNPLLEVSIDSRVILDGEIVSPRPSIEIVLSDNNSFQPLDSTLIHIEIHNSRSELMYNNDDFVFRLNEDGTKLNAFLMPSDTLPDGIYELKVDATDQSGNEISEKSFEIHFKVVNKSTITRFYPYPNPFSDKMRFVFTLTGLNLPDEIDIRIMTITGRVVRQINMTELGAIHIGDNISDFYWDGTDQYGNQLGNGVYLYQVLVKNSGHQVELSAQQDDRGFKNNIGKIYLLR